MSVALLLIPQHGIFPVFEMTKDRSFFAEHVRETLNHPRYRADIDGLRALAVLAVVGFHSFPEWIKGGFVGVDVFFVISGYLISGMIFESLDRGTFSFVKFYARRIRRIFPALILVLLTGWIFGWMYLLPADFRQLGKHMLGGAGFAANFMFWKEAGYFDQVAAAKPLLHLWSLGIEEQFYISMPFLWYLAWRFHFGLGRLTLLLGAVSFALNLALIHHDPVGVFYSPLTRIWEILLGSLLASFAAGRGMAAPTRLKPWNAAIPDNLKSLTGLLLVVMSVLLIHKQQAFPGWRALLPVLGTALLVAAGPHALLNRRVLANRLLVWLGLISYPLYLWHWLLLSLTSRYFPEGELDLEIRGAVVLLSIVLAVLTYLLIERPVRFARRGKRWKTMLLCLAMLSTATVGLATWQHDGFKSRFRFDQAILKLTAKDEPFREKWLAQIREGTCHLDGEATRFDDCVESRRPLLFLWGDSHAAALYPGLRNLQQRKSFGIAQFTLGTCPPILEFIDRDVEGRKNCPEVNQNILDTVRSLKPEIVMLHAHWESPAYALYDPQAKQFDVARLKKTIEAIQAAGAGRVVLIGPVPSWKWYLNDILFIYYRWDDPGHEFPPLRMNEVHGGLKDIDASMRRFASDMHIEFISAADVFCNDEGCLTRLGDDYVSLTTLDMSHLTPLAAQYLIDRIASRLLPSANH